ncbi:MAG: carboxypeptidase regulatory-like domain-containing protein [Myxococcales bacterium]|nr:carboxypeptidase regulatory-like domain-containing protein [Myxococcales bacterium]
MKPRSLAAVAAILVAVAAVWFFALRKGPGKATPKPSTPGVAAGTGAGSTRPPGPDRPDRGGDRDTPILIDDDPAGELRLEGLVLDANDKPVADATVVVSTNPSRQATTDTDGSFAFDKLVGRPYTLVARAPGGVGGPTTAKLTATSDPVVLHLRPAGSVKVTVVEKKDAPVAGATVELRGLDQQTMQTGADGVATFPVVAAGGYEVVAAAPGFAPSRQFTRIAAVPEELTLALVAGAAVAGRVVDDTGAAVAGARVAYSGASDWSVQADERKDGVVTDATGRFTFAALPAGSFRFVARHERFAPGTSAIVTLDGSHATDGVEIKLTGGATIAGKVVDDHGGPVASAQVRIAVASRGMIGSEPRQVFSDSDGRFVIAGLPKKPLDAVAIAESGSSKNVAVDASGGDVGDVVLTIDQTGTIAGVVVDKAGEPIAGAQVSAFPDFRSGTSGDPGQFRLRGFPQELTNAGGEFKLVGLAPGAYMVRASRNPTARGRVVGFEGEKAETGTTGLRIVLPLEGGIKGKVAFADGTVPTPFTVGVGFASEPVASKDGRFELHDLPPQKYQLTIRGGEFDPRTVEVTVEEGQIADAGDIVVKKGRVIAGRVTMRGQPVVGAMVYAGGQIFGTGSSNTAAMGGPPGRGGSREATTDEEGKFRISGLGPAPLAVVAEHPDLGRSAAVRLVRGAPNEQALELTLAGWGVLTGKVIDDAGPAENTIITAQSANVPNAMYSVASGDDGTFRFDKLAPDTYKVSAMLGNPMRGMAFYSKQVVVGPDQPATVDLAVETGSVSVALKVTASNGDVQGGVGWLISGVVAATNVDELNLIAGQQQAGTTKFGLLMGGRPASFEGVRPGSYTACTAVLPAGLQPMQGMQYFQNHATDLPVLCKAAQVTAAPATQTIELATTLPALVPDP